MAVRVEKVEIYDIVARLVRPVPAIRRLGLPEREESAGIGICKRVRMKTCGVPPPETYPNAVAP